VNEPTWLSDEELPELNILPNLDLERAFLGCLLVNPELTEEASGIVSIEDLASPRHQRIYDAILTLGSQADILTVCDFLRQAGELDRVGGVDVVAALSDGVTRSRSCRVYAERIKDASVKRVIASRASELRQGATNGRTQDELREMIAGLAAACPETTESSAPIDLYSPDVRPVKAEFVVRDLIRKKGLHLLWAPPSGGKTYLLLRIVHELLAADPEQRLLGHPHLEVRAPWRRILWIATEESAGGLRYRADMVRAGMPYGYQMAGELLYVFAAASGHRVTLDDLPALYAQHGPFDACILDSLTGLRPKTVNGERVRWDVDNDAANEMCLLLRGLAEEHETALFLVHHTGREIAKGYRGPTDWWASADVMLGLLPDHGRTKVQVDKNRDGARIETFYLTPSWERGAFTVTYEEAIHVLSASLSGNAQKVLAYLRGAESAVSQAKISEACGLTRSTSQRALADLIEAELVRDTGIRGPKGSPVYALLVPTGAHGDGHQKDED